MIAPEIFLVVSPGRPRELVRSLSKEGQKVRHCTPDEVAEELDSHSVKAILIDGGQKHRQDFRLLGKIKARHPGVPIIYLAEGGSEGTAVEAFRKGARDYYRKPVNLYDLRRNVLRLVALQRFSDGRRRPYLWAPLEMAAPLSGVRSNLPSNLLRAVAYMEDHFDGEISLFELAEQSRMSKYYFCRVFKKVFGRSPVQYLINLRVERAKIILRTTDLAVGEISALAGFGGTSNFSRTFKRLYSTTPSLFRRGGEPL